MPTLLSQIMSEASKNQMSALFRLFQSLAIFLSGYYFYTLNSDVATLKTAMQEVKIINAQMSIQIDMLSKKTAMSITTDMQNKTTFIKNFPSVYDTVNAVKATARKHQFDKSVTMMLQRYPFKNEMGWYEKVFNWLAANTTYKFDPLGLELVKAPDSFVLVDGFGDCDDYTTFWGALLNRADIVWQPKIVKYASDPKKWAHIYPVCPVKDYSKYAIFDNVYGIFNKEVNHSYSETL